MGHEFDDLKILALQVPELRIYMRSYPDSVRLHDETTELELRIAGYQFALQETADGPADASWDSNWLVVEGAVRASDGTQWTFRDPCLTTWEVAKLSDWLQQTVAEATTATANTDADGEVAEWLTFTEPNLSFAVVSLSESQAELTIVLSHEAAAPPLEPQLPKRSEISIVTSKREIQNAAIEMREQLSAYPVR